MISKGSIAAALLVSAMLVAGCERPFLFYLPQDSHLPAYQEVNTVEKARTVYSDTTLISKVYQYLGSDGNMYQEVPPPNERGQAEAIASAVEYFSSDGRVFRATSASTEVIQGTWDVKKSGPTYPQLCTTYPTRPISATCRKPDDLFLVLSESQLFRGDISGVGQGRYPTRLRGVEVTAFWNEVADEIAPGNSDYFTENEIR